MTANDRTNAVFNGDLGVTVATPEGARVAFPGADGARPIAPVRLASVETVHAMTIHKSQGSEFDHVVVVLPPAGSRLATRELLYTAVTRARRRVTLVGPPRRCAPPSRTAWPGPAVWASASGPTASPPGVRRRPDPAHWVNRPIALHPQATRADHQGDTLLALPSPL